MSKTPSTHPLVIDSCIWIDLAKGGVLEEVFQLPHKIIDPDVLIQEEVRSTNLEKLVNLGLNLIPASSENVVEVSRINNSKINISFYDASALELANRMNGVLLTDDGQLIKTAREYSVQVEGVTWLLNELATHRCISGPKAITALERINQSGHTIRDEEIESWKERWTE